MLTSASSNKWGNIWTAEAPLPIIPIFLPFKLILFLSGHSAVCHDSPFQGFSHYSTEPGIPVAQTKNTRPLKSSRPLNSGIIGLCSPPMQLMSQLYSKTDSFPLLFAVSSHFEVFSFQNALVISVLNFVLFVSLLWVPKMRMIIYESQLKVYDS